MTALEADKAIQRTDGTELAFPVGNGETLYGGAFVSVDADGYAVAGDDATGEIFQGVCMEQVDNSAGSDGDKQVVLRRRGLFKAILDTAITQANVGDNVFLVDDQTVDLTANVTYNIFCGIIAGYIDTTHAWIDIEPAVRQADVATHIADTTGAHAASAISIADAGTFTAQTEAEAALQEIYQHLLSIQHFIPILLTTLREAASNQIAQAYDTVTVDVPLASLRETDASNVLAATNHYGVLGQDSTPILDFANGDTDSNLRIAWAATNQDAIVAKVSLPDIDVASDVTLRIRAAMSDTNNTPVIDVDSYFNEGDTKVSDATEAVTGATVANYDVTIAAADVPAGAITLTFELTPAAHANDALYIYQIEVIYTAATANDSRGVLGPDTTPILGFTNGDTDSALRLAWAAGNQDPIVFQTPLPPNLDTTANVVLHLRAAMSNTNDTPTIASDVYFNEGDTKVEDASAAITGATYAEYTITVAAADVPTGAQTMTCELTPGAHASDLLYVTSIGIEHKGALLTS